MSENALQLQNYIKKSTKSDNPIYKEVDSAKLSNSQLEALQRQ